MFRIRINFFRIRIRIQRLRLETNTDPDPDPIRIQGFNDQKLKKNNSWKKITFFFWSKTAIYLSLGLHKVCPSYRRSLQLTKEAIQHFKTWIFSTFVGHFCAPGFGSGFRIRIRIRIHWPDWIRIQSGSETLVLTSVPNPKPTVCVHFFKCQNCIKLRFTHSIHWIRSGRSDFSCSVPYVRLDDILW